MEKLDFSPLHKALETLDEALGRSVENDTLLRDGCIQRFEYTYELAIRMLRRQLEQVSHSKDEIDHASFRDMIRMGAEKGLIDDPEAWFEFRNKRNITSHTYNENKAKDVFSVIPMFAKKTRLLLNCLEKT
ncbi:MAG: nucleotidyltransferase substrate binding protein [Mariprofundaceae bacterium]